MYKKEKQNWVTREKLFFFFFFFSRFLSTQNSGEERELRIFQVAEIQKKLSNTMKQVLRKDQNFEKRADPFVYFDSRSKFQLIKHKELSHTQTN